MNEKGQIALLGEELAAQWLVAQGYRILDRNYRVGHKEIDIVAQKDGVLVFCEVKARRNQNYGSPADAITPRKLSLLAFAASAYLSMTRGSWTECRIDAILVELGDAQPRITHLPNAYVHLP